MVHKDLKKIKGVSLLELLAVMAILLILIGVITPAILRVRDNSRAVMCISSIKQISLAVLQYSLDNEHLPNSLYEVEVIAYYGNDPNVALCPSDERDILPAVPPRGSFGINSDAANFSAVAPVIPLVADADEEDLTVSSFRARHKNNKRGNVAYLDGHVEQVTEDDFTLTP